MKRYLSVGLVFLVMVCTAMADTFYDQNVPGGTGWYNGTGGIDGHFVNTQGDYGGGNTGTASLRLAERFVGPKTPTDNNNYACLAAQQCNVEFSFYTNTLKLSDFTYLITINNISTGLSLSLDPSLIPDNTYWTSNIGGSETMVKDLANQVGMQNSEYLGFSFLQIPLNWHPTDELLVTFAFNPANPNIGRGDAAVMRVNASAAVPEPASMILLGTAMTGFVFIARRRRRKE